MLDLTLESIVMVPPLGFLLVTAAVVAWRERRGRIAREPPLEVEVDLAEDPRPPARVVSGTIDDDDERVTHVFLPAWGATHQHGDQR